MCCFTGIYIYLAETIFSIVYNDTRLKGKYENLKSQYSIEGIKDICKIINSENSTHLRMHELEAITEMIFKAYPTIIDFKNVLKAEDYTLVTKIRNLKNNPDDKKEKIRDNYSFATKFCHYSSYYLFNNEEDEEYRDMYPIYDSVVVRYIKGKEEYKNKDLYDYNNYVKTIDEIIGDNGISRNGFDHLIWLAYRKQQ